MRGGGGDCGGSPAAAAAAAGALDQGCGGVTFSCQKYPDECYHNNTISATYSKITPHHGCLGFN